LSFGRKKKGSGILPALFLCRLPPSLWWLLIGVNKDFLEVINHGRISAASSQPSPSQLMVVYSVLLVSLTVDGLKMINSLLQ